MVLVKWPPLRRGDKGASPALGSAVPGQTPGPGARPEPPLQPGASGTAGHGRPLPGVTGARCYQSPVLPELGVIRALGAPGLRQQRAGSAGAGRDALRAAGMEGGKVGAAGAAAEEDPEPGLGRGMAVLKSPWDESEGPRCPGEGSETCGRCSGSCGHRDTGGNGNGLRGSGLECGGKALAVGEQKHSWSATKC